jgi:hypothetical protein
MREDSNRHKRLCSEVEMPQSEVPRAKVELND